MKVKKIYDTLIFDMNNLYYRAFYTNKEKVTVINSAKLSTNGIFGSLNMIKRRINIYLKEGGSCYFLFDNPTTSHNRAKGIDPNYKANRNSEDVPKTFYRGLDYLEYVLRRCYDNCFIVRETDTEADDWVKPILKENCKDKMSLMVSTDMDWARSLSDKVHWLFKDNIFTQKEFEFKYKFKASESSVCFYKAFYGDPVDNIRGCLKQLPKEYFRRIAESYTDMSAFIKDVSAKKLAYLDDGWVRRVDKEKHRLLSAWALVTFAPITNVELERYTMKSKFDKLGLKVLYKSLRFPDNFDERLVDEDAEYNILTAPNRLKMTRANKPIIKRDTDTKKGKREGVKYKKKEKPTDDILGLIGQ